MALPLDRDSVHRTEYEWCIDLFIGMDLRWRQQSLELSALTTSAGEDRLDRAVAARTLGALVDHSQQLDTVRKRDLRHGDWIVVLTRNSAYSICFVGEDLYAVSGGWFDRQSEAPLTVAVNGCTWGGTAIKSDILAAPGLFLEFGNRVRTTRIQGVQVFRGDLQPHHFFN